ncbi:MAG: FliA/WhiG family RNA polymerase sigma factor [Actinomycetota bacterium]|nr:FliA/WhiG family RNA polymerase sigma factor [Actinomycetota bacterium]
MSPRTLDADLERAWGRWTRQRAPGAREQLIVHYSALVKFVAGRLGVGDHAAIDANDLVSAGMLGLIDAVERFDPAHGVRFETFATPRIRGAIYDGLRQLDWVPRSVRARARQIERAIADFEGSQGRSPSEPELASSLGLDDDQLAEWIGSVASTVVGTLDHALEAGAEPSSLEGGAPQQPGALVEARELRTAMFRALRTLPEREKLVVALYFEEGLTLSEIGDVLGVTESRVSQLRITAVMRLRARLHAGGLV